MKDQDKRIPQVEKAVLYFAFMPRQWHSAQVSTPPEAYSYIFTAVYAKSSRNATCITVARIECNQPEPQWEHGGRERMKVMAMLQEAIGKAVGKPTQKFRGDIVEWEVRH